MTNNLVYKRPFEVATAFAAGAFDFNKERNTFNHYLDRNTSGVLLRSGHIGELLTDIDLVLEGAISLCNYLAERWNDLTPVKDIYPWIITGDRSLPMEQHSLATAIDTQLVDGSPGGRIGYALGPNLCLSVMLACLNASVRADKNKSLYLSCDQDLENSGVVFGLDRAKDQLFLSVLNNAG